MSRRRAATALTLLLAGALVSVACADALRETARSAAPAAGCTPLAAGTHRIAVQAGRVPVVLHVPPRLRRGAPLVLALPGAGQTARDFAAYTGYSRLSDMEGFAVAYATASGSRPLWNVTDRIPRRPQDVPYLRAVIPAVVRAACADPARVGVTGVSNGGGMSARLACDAADLVAAAAPVAGSYGVLPDCHPSRPVPILEIHGTSDTVVPYGGRTPVAAFLSQWRRLDGCIGRPRERRVEARVTELRSTRCAGGTEVVHDRIDGEQHGWPGAADVNGDGGYSATRRTWSFLSSFRRSMIDSATPTPA